MQRKMFGYSVISGKILWGLKLSFKNGGGGWNKKIFHFEELFKEYVSWGGKFKFAISFELEPSPGLLEGGLKGGEISTWKRL